MARFIPVSLFTFFLVLSIAAAQNNEPIVIDPSLKNYDSLPEIKPTSQFWIDSVQDSASIKDSGVVGWVHTKSKHPTAIVCKPLPGDAVRQSLQTLFAHKAVAAAERNSATYAVQIVLLTFTLKEKPHFIYRTIEATVKFELRLTDVQTGRVTRIFSIESKRSRAALDAGHKAQEVARDALYSAFTEAALTLNSL
jgi:hypothetical protein